MALIGPMKYLTIGGSTYEIQGQEITSSAITSALGYTPYNGSTNPNGYITSFTDEKLKTTAVTSGTTYYPIVGINSTTAANKNYDSTGFSYAGTNGTANGTNGNALLTLGNNTASTTANWKKGTLRLYGTSSSYTDIVSAVTTTARTITLPNATGTVALTSDIPDVSGKIDTAGTGLSKSGTTLNHSNSVTAQTTQAIYPIKIDAQGHISAYGTAVTPLTASSTLDATKLSGTIPAACYTDTDTKVTNTVATAATTYYLTGSTNSSTVTGELSKHGSLTAYTTADSATSGYTQLRLGNTTATSSVGGKEGQIRLYGTNATYYLDLKPGAIASSNKTITFPNATGTVALTSDIPDISGKIDTAGTGLSKSGTTLNHSNSVTAKSTQAVYPITFDAQGHITGAGSAATILTIGTGASNAAAGNHTHSTYVPLSADSTTIKSNQFRIQNNTSSATGQAGSYPYVSSLMLGDGREVTIDEYGDGYLGIHSKYGIFLQSNSTAIDVYDSTKTYSLNALVWYDKKYYRCTTAITTAEQWTAAHWTQVPSGAGTIVTQGNIQPLITNTNSLGTSTYKWSDVQTTKINNVAVPSITAQTTQAIYPIAINALGQITSYGSAVTVSTTDTKNTAGSTDTSSKIYLIGATSQAANPQTYSHDTAYVGTDGKLYSASKVVLTGGSNAASSVSITPTTTAVYSMTSAGSVTAGTKASFTRGTFSQGTLPTMTWAMDSTDTKKLNITFSQGTLPTHAADSFTANTPTAVTLPGRSSVINAWTGYSAATAAAQTFTGVTA